MTDVSCALMGIFDIVAGIMIFIGFGLNPFGFIVGGVLVIKGVISLI